MALINCNNCGNQMSDQAFKCPHCGADNQILKQDRKNQTYTKGEQIMGRAIISNTITKVYIVLIVIATILFLTIPIMILPCAIVIVFCIYKIVQIGKFELYYTNKRVVGKTALLDIKSLDTPLNKINNVSVQNSIFGYGIVRISSSSGNYRFGYITNAEEMKNGLMEQIEKYEQEKIKEQAIQMAKAMRGEETIGY